MVDINPNELKGPFTPRESTIVDAIAESRRIADQAMRNNPLVDAVISQGFTRFAGNYGQNYALFGDFTPNDRNLLDEFGEPQPQRGVHFERDDPQHNAAFSMYDFDPKTGVPLRQRIYMHDADGKALMHEGHNGGRAFPDQPIVMYQRESIDPSGAGFTADRTMYSGSGNLTGTRLEFSGAWTNSDAGATTISTYLRCSGGGVTITQPTLNIAGNQNYFVDVDVKAIFDVTDFINVEWHMWRTAGGGTFVPRIFRCRTYSYLFQ